MSEGKKKKGSFKSLAEGLAVGAALGALIGILFAPKKGSETRKDIEEGFYRAKADVARKLVKAKKVTAVQYKKAVEEAVKMQAKTMKTLKKADLNDIKDRLMDGWDTMAGKMASSKPVKAIKKAVKATKKKKA
ncbi:YtxH domain-containing protein [Patescibacteria group bacterium]|nr:MAG: YtxH domain-containing protein [Patescibacteria group bacterium]